MAYQVGYTVSNAVDRQSERAKFGDNIMMIDKSVGIGYAQRSRIYI